MPENRQPQNDLRTELEKYHEFQVLDEETKAQLLVLLELLQNNPKAMPLSDGIKTKLLGLINKLTNK